jgi:hypothetical protein
MPKHSAALGCAEVISCNRFAKHASTGKAVAVADTYGLFGSSKVNARMSHRTAQRTRGNDCGGDFVLRWRESPPLLHSLRRRGYPSKPVLLATMKTTHGIACHFWKSIPTCWKMICPATAFTWVGSAGQGEPSFYRISDDVHSLYLDQESPGGHLRTLSETFSAEHVVKVVQSVPVSRTMSQVSHFTQHVSRPCGRNGPFYARATADEALPPCASIKSSTCQLEN